MGSRAVSVAHETLLWGSVLLPSQPVWTAGKTSGFGHRSVDARLGLGKRKACVTHEGKRGSWLEVFLEL